MRVDKKRYSYLTKGKCLSLVCHEFFYSILFILLPIIATPFASNADNSPISIEQVSIDQTHLGIFVSCLVNDPDLLDKLTADSNKLTLDILTDANKFKDVVIKDLEQVTESKLEFYVQLPLEDAIYKAEKRTYVLKLKLADTYHESRVEAALGSALKNYDLRAYNKLDIQAILTSTIFILVIISVLLMLLQPFYQNFKFKRDYIKKFISVKEEDQSSVLDPFTFVEIQDTDEVVVRREQILLLSSWKRLKKIPETQVAKDHAIFFRDQEEGTFFNPRSINYKKINKAWYAVLGLCFGWLLFSLVVSFFVDSTSNFVAIITDNKSIKVSQYVTHEMLFGLCLGLCFGMALIIGKAITKKSFKIDNSQLIQPLIRMVFVLIAMAFQVLINTIIMEYTGKAIELISWVTLAVALNFPIHNFKYHVKNKIMVGVLSGCIAFSVYQLLNITYVIDSLGVNFASLLSVISLGLSLGLLTELTITKTVIKNKVEQLLAYKKEDKNLMPVTKPLTTGDISRVKKGGQKDKIITKKKTAIVEDIVESN